MSKHKYTLEQIKESMYFFETDGECCYEGDCHKEGIGCLFLWYDAEDDIPSVLATYCEEHLLELSDHWEDL